MAATSTLTYTFAGRAAKATRAHCCGCGSSSRSFFVAIVAVLFFLPLPPWMKIEQATCGALLLATAVIMFRPLGQPAPEPV